MTSMWTSITRAVRSWGYTSQVKSVKAEGDLVSYTFKNGEVLSLIAMQKGNTRFISKL